MFVALAAANRWLRTAEMPIAAMTPENASSTGSPAATSAPKASSMIRSVIGSASLSALLKSLLSVCDKARSALASPASWIEKPGWARWTLATVASAGATRFFAVSVLPTISKRMIAA